jgi:hypothetical protein
MTILEHILLVSSVIAPRTFIICRYRHNKRL